MFKNLFIKKIVAVTMMVIFAISITPTIVFHNWLVEHTDTVKRSAHNTGEHIGKITFNCHCDHIVAESPFTEPAAAIITPFEQVFSPVGCAKQIFLTVSPHIFHSLRGPPAV